MEPPLKKLRMDYSTAVSPMRRKHETITLLPAEKLLRDLLLECRAHLQENGVAATTDLRMWITGGWVRDRLLDIPCSDIDIALSTMTGKQFGDLLTEYYQARKAQYEQRAAELGIKDTKFTSFHTTKKNVGKSKNLETTMGRVYGLDLDLVNLRKEVYDEDSRTPGMEFGTPEEDAFRRDANVNSLFFDLDKQEVVDLTGKGLDDMEAGIVRTPLEPRKTFLDDPLRVLRLIRFASKLGYRLDAETEKWMSDSEIHKALNAKVSRERVGIEVFKMMKQPNPQIAFKVVFDANLYELVFLGLDAALHAPLMKQLPGIGEENPWPATWPRAYQVLAMLLRDETTELGRMVHSEQADLLWVMAAYAPVAGLRNTMLKKVVAAATEAIKMTTNITKLLDSSLRHVDGIRKIIALVGDNDAEQPPRSTVGMAIQSWGETWKLQVVYSLLSEIVYDPCTIQPSSYLSHDNGALEALLCHYNSFMDYVTEKKLHDAHLLRPVLDGNEMMKLFGVKKGGKFLKMAIDDLLAWQFDHPDAGTEEATNWLLQQRGRLGIPSAGA